MHRRAPAAAAIVDLPERHASRAGEDPGYGRGMARPWQVRPHDRACGVLVGGGA